MPQKGVKLIKHKHKMSALITHGIIRYIQYRDNLYKSIRLAEKSYYEILFPNFKNDIRGTWKTINGI